MATKIPLVMTLIGPDRTGLVEAVAHAVAEQGGNWTESRMCRLGGEFAGILRIEIPEPNQQALVLALQGISGLNVVIRSDLTGSPKLKTAPAPDHTKSTRLEIVGADRPGIVREITRALSRAQINVEEFSSEVASAPMSGEALFKATARLQLPATCDRATLKRELEAIGADLLVEVVLTEV